MHKNVDRRTSRDETTWGLRLRWEVDVKWMLEKQNGSGYGQILELYEHGNESSCSIKTTISRPAEQQVTFQERHSIMQLNSFDLSM
jgi:hypothetical protein